MKTRLFSLLILVLTVTSCSSWRQNPAQRGHGPNIPALEWAVVTYGDEMEREKRLRLEDSRAYYDEYVEYVWMVFSTMDDMYPYEARDLVVYLVEGFLARVNEDPTIAYDVYTYPFSVENLLIDIHFESFHNLYEDTRSIARISVRNGMVWYYAADALDPDTVFYHRRCEPYEKAYRFSKYKTYRPWVQEKPSDKDFSMDVSLDPGNGGAIFRGAPPVYNPRIEPRPRLRRQEDSRIDREDSLGPPSLLPDLSKDLPTYDGELEERFP